MAYRVARDLRAVKEKFGAGLATSLGSDLGLNFGATTFFEQGEDAVRAATAKSKELGVAGKASAEAWAKFVDTLVSLRQAAAELVRTLMTGLTPAITGILDRMRGWLERNQEWLDQKITDAIAWLAQLIGSIDWTAVVDGAKAFVTQVKSVVAALGGWKQVGEELLALWAFARIAPILANIALLVAALAGGGVGSIIGGALGLLTAVGGFLLGEAFLTKLKESVGGGGGLSPEGMEYGPQLPGHVARQGVEGERGGGGSSTPALTTEEQKSRGLEFMDELIKRGWTPEAAAIAAGNAQQESGFKFNASGDPSIPGGSHDLMQWNRDRLLAFQSFNR